MIRLFLTRILLPLIAFLVIRALLSSIGKMFRESNLPQESKQGPSFKGGELKKDPVCGTFVSVDSAVTKKVNGAVLHFCSTSCRDKYTMA